MRGRWWLGVIGLVVGFSTVACDATTSALAPAGAAAPAAPVAAEVDPFRAQSLYYQQGVHLLGEWSREDTAVGALLAQYPPATEADVNQIRRELRRLELLVTSFRELSAPPGTTEAATQWARLLDLRQREIALYRQFYREDWRQNAKLPREESVWYRADRLDAEADELSRTWQTQAGRFLAEHPAPPVATLQ